MTDSQLDAEELIDRFSYAMARALARHRGNLSRVSAAHNDHAFTVTFPTAALRFVGKLRQQAPGEWGLGSAAVEALDAEPRPVVLLTADTSGYLVGAEEWPRVVAACSHDAHGALRVSEQAVTDAEAFANTDELAALLAARVAPGA